MRSARGLAYALASVTLGSAAQLALRWSVIRLPRIGSPPAALVDFHLLAVAVLVLGILVYAVSLLCWLGALANMPLNTAYSLLSLSYPLVYLCGALVPGLHGTLSAGRAVGVLLVMLGVVVINARQVRPVNSSHARS
jgi:undecaprenyl phosphate-alpha-L-ara4N flippase subunit ArnF